LAVILWVFKTRALKIEAAAKAPKPATAGGAA